MIKEFFNRLLVENFKKIVAKVSTIPKPDVDDLFADAKILIAEADHLDDSATAAPLSGWDKLKWVVDKLKPLLPQGYGEIASTVLTIIVAGARLFVLLKK